MEGWGFTFEPSLLSCPKVGLRLGTEVEMKVGVEYRALQDRSAGALFLQAPVNVVPFFIYFGGSDMKEHQQLSDVCLRVWL